MSLFNLLMALVNTLCLVGFAILWSRFQRPPKEDPRLQRSFNTLQSKLSILEDLSDRVDQQVIQVNTILDRKHAELRAQITESEKERDRIEQCRQKSLETAKIFQDRIPHHEIIERTQMTKYVQVAKQAHAGMSIEEICAQTDIPRAEVEFIVKLNRDQLVFDENRLPGWIEQPSMPTVHHQNVQQLAEAQLASSRTQNDETPTTDDLEFRRLSEAFKSAQATSPNELIKRAAQSKVRGAEMIPDVVRPYEFPRL